MTAPFLGEVRMFGSNFAPRGWVLCSGQILPIAQNTALFSLIGTFYGGNGTSTFGLPDLRGRRPVHQGQSVSTYVMGESGGLETVVVSTTQLPAHLHTTAALAGAGTANSPAGNLWAAWSDDQYSTAGVHNTQLASAAIGNSGLGLPHDNMAPYLAVTFILCVSGVFPSRN
jgi:microcystin-dependent protein